MAMLWHKIPCCGWLAYPCHLLPPPFHTRTHAHTHAHARTVPRAGSTRAPGANRPADRAAAIMCSAPSPMSPESNTWWCASGMGQLQLTPAEPLTGSVALVSVTSNSNVCATPGCCYIVRVSKVLLALYTFGLCVAIRQQHACGSLGIFVRATALSWQFWVHSLDFVLLYIRGVFKCLNTSFCRAVLPLTSNTSKLAGDASSCWGGVLPLLRGALPATPSRRASACTILIAWP